jgi:H+-transporting ATPase
VSSLVDIAIASTLAVAGIAMARLPVLLVAGTLAAAALFAFVLDLIKVPVFARLGIAQSPVTGGSKKETKGKPLSAMQPPPKLGDGKSEEHPQAASEKKPERTAETPSNADPTPEAKTGAPPKAKVKAPGDLTPQLVKRVHDLDENLGREDVRAVQEWDKAQEKSPADE